jgi:hypothetical protein
VSDRTACGECGAALPRGGGRLAIWGMNPLVRISSCCLLCAACWASFQERGPGPNAWNQSQGDARAAQMKRDDAPLVRPIVRM